MIPIIRCLMNSIINLGYFRQLTLFPIAPKTGKSYFWNTFSILRKHFFQKEFF